jgi:hypothetical protein
MHKRWGHSSQVGKGNTSEQNCIYATVKSQNFWSRNDYVLVFPTFLLGISGATPLFTYQSDHAAEINTMYFIY